MLNQLETCPDRPGPVVALVAAAEAAVTALRSGRNTEAHRCLMSALASARSSGVGPAAAALARLAGPVSITDDPAAVTARFAEQALSAVIALLADPARVGALALHLFDVDPGGLEPRHVDRVERALHDAWDVLAPLVDDRRDQMLAELTAPAGPPADPTGAGRAVA